MCSPSLVSRWVATGYEASVVYCRFIALRTHWAAKCFLPAHSSVVLMDGSGAVVVTVVEYLVATTTTYEGSHMAVGECVVVYQVATHL